MSFGGNYGGGGGGYEQQGYEQQGYEQESYEQSSYQQDDYNQADYEQHDQAGGYGQEQYQHDPSAYAAGPEGQHDPYAAGAEGYGEEQHHDMGEHERGLHAGGPNGLDRGRDEEERRKGGEGREREEGRRGEREEGRKGERGEEGRDRDDNKDEPFSGKDDLHDGSCEQWHEIGDLVADKCRANDREDIFAVTMFSLEHTCKTNHREEAEFTKTARRFRMLGEAAEAGGDQSAKSCGKGKGQGGRDMEDKERDGVLVMEVYVHVSECVRKHEEREKDVLEMLLEDAERDAVRYWGVDPKGESSFERDSGMVC